MSSPAALMPSVEEKREWIERRVDSMFAEPSKSALIALDLDVNLLICAARSYKFETVLKPFPSTLLSHSNNNKNYEQLQKIVESLPPVNEWQAKIKKFNSDQLSLVYWFLVHKNYQMQHCTTLSQEKLKELAKYTENFTKPTHIFEVKQSDEKNKKFDSLKAQTIEQHAANLITTTSFCFHGTRLENVYSILHNGLLSHFNKNSVFGEGTYLSQEPSVSLHYSPSNKTWEKSLIGQRMSCLLVCETINDPNHVNVGLKESSDSTSKTKSQISNSKVPEKYFIVKNNEYVRIRYLLVYAEKSKIKKKNKLQQILSENKFVIMLMLYSLLLVFIGLMNSRTFHKYVKLSYRTLSNYLMGHASATYE